MGEPIGFLDGRVTLHPAEALATLRGISDASIDSVVTDPPYALVSIVKRFANSPRSERTENTENPYGRTGRGFMGQRWDTGETAFAIEFWSEVLRVLKPGGHVVAFGGTRTYHRLAVSIEDAGFEIRDQLAWCYGSGFPKSHDVSKGIDRQAGAAADVERWQGWGTALKPAWEPIVLARKSLGEDTVAANVLRHGTGALNIDGCRVAGEMISCTGDGFRTGKFGGQIGHGDTTLTGQPWSSHEKGRHPANIIHDGSDEVVAAFPDSDGSGPPRVLKRSGKDRQDGWGMDVAAHEAALQGGGAGSAARFFYSAKADADDRIGSKHPTVKPVDLKRWLCRLVTPPGGLVLDPFAGTGTTGEAAYREGFSAILIERETEYQADIARRMALVLAGPDEKRHASLKARGKVEASAGPLFG